MDQSFLGRGWKFPVSVDTVSGQIRVSEYEEDIREAVRIIIGTAPGERVMRPDFGCGIHQYVFAHPDVSTLTLAAASVKEALIRWEPRIAVREVTALVPEQKPNCLEIHVEYQVRSTNSRFNLVYDFYLTEAR